MTLALLFWILMLFWLVFGVYTRWTAGAPAWGPVMPDIVLFLLLLLGWAAFGAPLRV